MAKKKDATVKTVKMELKAATMSQQKQKAARNKRQHELMKGK